MSKPGPTEGLVPDHRDKARIASYKASQMNFLVSQCIKKLCFPHTVVCYVYSSIVSKKPDVPSFS